MATTTHGYPYPTGADKVRDGDDSIKALADKVEARLLGGIWSGGGFAAAVAAGSNKTISITYPVGMFATGANDPAPNAVVTYWGNAPQSQFCAVQGLYAASVSVIVQNSYTVGGDIYFIVHAHQP